MRIPTIILALSLACATQAAFAQATSGGPVDSAVIENLSPLATSLPTRVWSTLSAISAFAIPPIRTGI